MGEKVLYFDISTFEDFDKVLEFFSNHKVRVLYTDHDELVIMANITPGLVNKMQSEVRFRERVSVGDRPPN